MVYSKQVEDHYNNPRNVGSLNKDDAGVGTAWLERLHVEM